MRFIIPFPSSFSLSVFLSTFSNRVILRFKEEGNFKLRIVQPSPHSLLNRSPHPSDLAWKIMQASSRGKDGSTAVLRPGSEKERPPQTMPHMPVMGQTAAPGNPSRAPHFMDEETKTERE